MGIGGTDHQRPQAPQLFLKQPCSTVAAQGPEAVAAHEFSELSAAMDLRVVLVAAPIVLAASWAVFHIGRAAVGQLQLMLKRARA